MMLYTVAVIVVLLFALATQMFKVLREYERGVVFFLGRFQEVKECFAFQGRPFEHCIQGIFHRVVQ